MIVIAPGSQPLIQAIPRLVARTDAAILGPTYREHAAAWTRHGHAVSEVDSVARLREARVAVVVNPNNPTGRIVPADELRQLAAVLADRQGLLIVDEAFADLASADTSIIENLPRSTIVLRSFGKAYGLAGLRLGFAVAHTAVAERLRAEIGPWPVSGPALAIGASRTIGSPVAGAAAADARRRRRAARCAACIVRAVDRGRHAAIPPAEPPARRKHCRRAGKRRHSRAALRGAARMAAHRTAFRRAGVAAAGAVVAAGDDVTPHTKDGRHTECAGRTGVRRM